jgi:hypothetical protein
MKIRGKGIMEKIAFYFILILFVYSNIIADESPSQISEVISQNNQYKLKLKNTTNENNNYIEHWELIKINSKEIIYDFFVCYPLSLSGKKIFISDDGNNIVLIDWFLPVRGNENQRDINNKIVIKFYFMGNEINRYKLSDVFNNFRRGIRSVSHFQWTGYNQNRDSIIMENNQIIIKTLELYEYIFNINNGTIVNRRRI